MLTPKFDQLVDRLRILPGVGPKTAQRMALYLLNQQRMGGRELAQALETAMTEIQQCRRCRGLSDETICPICQDMRRDDSLLCVVETAADVAAIEQTSSYRGRYFVLGGNLSPIDGVGADDIGIPLLLQRLQDEDIQELIVATNSTVEGQTTSHFIAETAKQYVKQVTRLAQGIPSGGELEYLDGVTLQHALQNRATF